MNIKIMIKHIHSKHIFLVFLILIFITVINFVNVENYNNLYYNIWIKLNNSIDFNPFAGWKMEINKTTDDAGRTMKVNGTAFSTRTIILYPKEKPFKCYKNWRNFKTLQDISKVYIRDGKNIIFLDTSCTSQHKGGLYLDPRQACAIESAAAKNPDLDIHVLFTAAAPESQLNMEDTSSVVYALDFYDNIMMSRIDLESYFTGTPVEELYKSGLMENSTDPETLLSVILRFVTMWKYGSTYLDFDVISIRGLDDLEPNFSGVDYDSRLSAGILNIEATERGRDWIEMILKDINKNFKKTWSANANDALTKLLINICNTNSTEKMTAKSCQGFHVHPADVFYSLDPLNLEDWFSNTTTEKGLGSLGNARTLQISNGISPKILAKQEYFSAYEILYMIHCPNVYLQFSNTTII